MLIKIHQGLVVQINVLKSLVPISHTFLPISQKQPISKRCAWVIWCWAHCGQRRKMDIILLFPFIIFFIGYLWLIVGGQGRLWWIAWWSMVFNKNYFSPCLGGGPKKLQTRTKNVLFHTFSFRKFLFCLSSPILKTTIVHNDAVMYLVNYQIIGLSKYFLRGYGRIILSNGNMPKLAYFIVFLLINLF